MYWINQFYGLSVSVLCYSNFFPDGLVFCFGKYHPGNQLKLAAVRAVLNQAVD